MLINSLLQPLHIRHEQVIAHQLNPVAQLFGQHRPTVPVVFGKAVFEGHDGIVIHPLRPIANHVFRSLRRLVGFLEDIFSILIELAGRRIERNRDLLARLVARLLNRFQHDVNALNIRLHRRSKSAFVADSRIVAALFQHALQCMKHFNAPAQRLGK